KTTQMPKFILPALLLLLLPFMGISQAASNLYIIDMERGNADFFQFRNPQLLTFDNGQFYNNQPFLMDSLLFYTASVDTTQTDLYLLDLEAKTRYRMTNSPESEYSPIVMPNGNYLSMVRVSADGNNSQQLWKMPLDLSGGPTVVMDRVKGVGCHEWLSDSLVAIFIVGNPHQLKLFDVYTQRFELIKSNVGRCLHHQDNGDFFYVDKSLEGAWFIKSVNFDQRRPTLTVVQTLKDVEDFAVTNDGLFLMGKGSKLYKFNAAIDDSWIEIADFTNWGIRNITRIDVETDKIVVVSNP
ncbi:MAG: hypothetical protein AAF598_07830, partial [Bacteroidota bacterium]